MIGVTCPIAIQHQEKEGMVMASEQEEAEARRAAIAVGELILTASALDHQLNRICIAALALTPSPMLEPLVATLDSTRKIEILRAYAGKLTAADWKKGLKDHAAAVEAVNRARNIAAHGVFSISNGKAVLNTPAAAKLLKSIDLIKKSAEQVDLARSRRPRRKRSKPSATAPKYLTHSAASLRNGLAARVRGNRYVRATFVLTCANRPRRSSRIARCNGPR